MEKMSEGCLEVEGFAFSLFLPVATLLSIPDFSVSLRHPILCFPVKNGTVGKPLRGDFKTPASL